MATMRLSEAIRLGIGVVQDDRNLWLFVPEVGCPHGCAIGTALYSVGVRTVLEYPELVERGNGREICEIIWPWTKATSAENEYMTIASLISFRHHCGESREAIAAWIESIEPKEEVSHEQREYEAQHNEDTSVRQTA